MVIASSRISFNYPRGLSIGTPIGRGTVLIDHKYIEVFFNDILVIMIKYLTRNMGPLERSLSQCDR